MKQKWMPSLLFRSLLTFQKPLISVEIEMKTRLRETNI
jgi:hypothetical protein